jgi:uncharacterized protein (TIGR03437 family)
MLRPFTLRKTGLLFALALVITAAATARLAQRSHAAGSKRQQLSFEDRVAAQRAIEAVYHRHRLWPADNPQPKPALDEVLPEAALRAKVEDYLRQSRALELWRARAITADELQAELERMARQTRLPAVLDELWAALGRDPFVIAECLARPLLAERLLRMRMADCGVRIGECESRDSSIPQSASRIPQFDQWWSGVREAMGVEVAAPEFAYRLPVIAAVAAPCGSDTWAGIISTTGAPSSRFGHTAVWTGSEMIIWGGAGGSVQNTGGRYNPATDTWSTTNTTGAPSARYYHSAVWTGSEMIIWGGDIVGDATIVNTGGRYNPTTNSWTTSITTISAPSARLGHSAAWTGSEMIIWGGATNSGGNSIFRDGGRYNPTTDSWTANITTTGAPSSRYFHSAVWTGSEMIVWGGNQARFTGSNDGGRYNPATDTWTANITTTGAPVARYGHSAVWTGSEMIIWSGDTIGNVYVNTGGRYNLATDSWTTTTTTGAPIARAYHSAVWAGSEMIVWGGYNSSGSVDTDRGRRYSLNILTTSPTTQSFTATGGPGSVAVTAQGGCTWTATSNSGFITITSGSSGAGNGTVNFSVAANTSQNARTGTLTIGAQTFTVTQSGENPLPTLSGLNPASASGGGSAFTLTVTGTGFVNGATARWNGANRTTNFVSNTQLSAQIPASDLMTLGPATITVFNPAPGGGASNALSFNVTASVSSISAASFSGAELAADSIVAAFGSELATQTLAAPVLPLPTTLAGTTVRVKDSAGAELLAPLFFVSPSQVNYLMPAGAAAGRATVTITSGNGKASLGAAQVAAVAPGLFAANANGQGVAAAVALRVRGGAQTFEPVAQFDAAAGRFVTAPIDLGPESDQVFLILFGTGIRHRSALSAVTAKIGGADAQVLFAGAQGGFAGLDQINCGPLPRSLAGRGEVDVVLTVDGKTANTVKVHLK